MKLSKRGEYGLKALIDLASQDDPTAVTQIKDIAARQQIPVKFLEQILLTLKNADSVREPDGLRALCVRGRSDVRPALDHAGRAQRHRRHSGSDHAGRRVDAGGKGTAGDEEPRQKIGRAGRRGQSGGRFFKPKL